MNKKFSLIHIISSFILAYVSALAFLNSLKKFDKLSDKNPLVLACIFGVVGASIALCVRFYRSRACKITKFWNWFDNSRSTFIILYVFFVITLSSIRSEVVWDLEQMRNFISLQWTIFGITITIFLVWNALIINNLKQKFPKPIQKQSILNKSHYINEKMQFYQNASFKFNSITFVIINLLTIIVSTGFLYIAFNEVNLINQNITIASFYFCTNTLIVILFDVLEPLISEKRILLKKSKVDYSEVSQLNDFQETMFNTITACAQIDNLQNIDDSEKDRMIKKLLSTVIDDDFENDKINQQSEGEE